MTVLVGYKAPLFSTQAVLKNGEIVEAYDFSSEIDNKYGVLFFYPLDFTFVCPSEIIALANRTAKLEELGCAVVGVSVDSHFTHNAWRNTDINSGGIGRIPFTLAADISRKITSAYGVLSQSPDSYYPAGVAMRATFVIDRSGIIRHQVINDEPLGRDMDSIVNVVESLQFFEEYGQVCPAGWKKGEPGMTNTPEGVASYLAKHGKEL